MIFLIYFDTIGLFDAFGSHDGIDCFSLWTYKLLYFSWMIYKKFVMMNKLIAKINLNVTKGNNKDSSDIISEVFAG